MSVVAILGSSGLLGSALASFFRRHYSRAMTLSQYIEKHGAVRCAAIWKVSVRTVHYWKQGKTKPQRGKLKRVMKSSGLTIADIYQ